MDRTRSSTLKMMIPITVHLFDMSTLPSVHGRNRATQRGRAANANKKAVPKQRISNVQKKKKLCTIRYYLDKYISPPYSSVTSTPPLFLRTRMLLLSLLRRLLLQIAHVLRVVVDLLLVGRNVRLGRRRQLLVPLALALLLLLELLLFDALELFGAAVGVFLQAELLSLREWADGGGAGGC
jgi:hypothetical protein